MCPASHEWDLRMPVVELTRPYPPRPPPESPVYPRCPECGGELGLDEYKADAGVIRCYGLRLRATLRHMRRHWPLGEWEDDCCPACGGAAMHRARDAGRCSSISATAGRGRCRHSIRGEPRGTRRLHRRIERDWTSRDYHRSGRRARGCRRERGGERLQRIPQRCSGVADARRGDVPELQARIRSEAPGHRHRLQGVWKCSHEHRILQDLM